MFRTDELRQIGGRGRKLALLTGVLLLGGLALVLLVMVVFPENRLARLLAVLAAFGVPVFFLFRALGRKPVDPRRAPPRRPRRP